MNITVLYFAVFREQLRVDREVLELGPGATVATALDALAARHAVIARLRGRFRCAVNEDFADDAHALADGDELALIPPVAGGAGGSGDGDARHIRVQAEPLSLDRVVAAVSGPGMGGLVTFTGMVRDHAHGAQIDHLEYEAYGAMAVREMTRIATAIEGEIAGTRIAVEHRVGSLAVGELAVVIAAAAPHRAEAFAACRAMIDRLKDSVPIWKKEFGTNGATWVGLGP